MADDIGLKWIYPPNFTGTFEKLPNQGKRIGPKKYVLQCTNYSDGTGEDDELKVKRTDLIAPGGGVPSKLVIEKICWHVAGMTVRVSYNNENDEEVAILYSGEGTINFTGGFTPEDDDQADNEGGDIVFNTSNETAGDSYTIELTVRPKD